MYYTADHVTAWETVNKQLYTFYVGIKGIYYFTDQVRAVSRHHHNFFVILTKMMNKEIKYISILCF